MKNSKKTLEAVLRERGPELTAYALGELSSVEREALKNEFSDNADVTNFLREIETLADLLSETVPQKMSHTLLETQREEVLRAQPQAKVFFWQKLKPKITIPALSAAAIATLCIVLLPKGQRVNVAIDEIDTEDPYSDYYRFAEDSDDGDVRDADDLGDVGFESAESTASESDAPYTFSPGSPSVWKSKSKSTSSANGVDLRKGHPTGVFGNTSSRDSIYKQGFGNDYAGEGLGSRLQGSSAKSLAPSTYAKSKEMAHGWYPSTAGGTYLDLIENVFQPVRQEPLSTFSIDVDTASYSQVRTELINSQLPPIGLVRAEEFINYFSYDYPSPTEGKPFSVNVEVTEAPWNTKHHLVRIGLRGRETSESARSSNNFVFLVDVSGSMDMPLKLPLVKDSMRMLVRTLRPKDRVAIVTYSGSTEVVLESTSGSNKREILKAIDALNADGSTNGESGIQLAYKIARDNKIINGNNRVVLATDGDFNVGVTDEGTLEEMIEKKAKSTGVFLTVLGYGMGNYHDSRMQKLANKGNGNNYYIDSAREARKVLVEQGVGTLNTIAKDVKIQVEFHPKHVQSYRLIGYEKRKLEAQDFNDDTKDAGEIGEGHTVTALYEIVPVGVPGGTGTVDALKYQNAEPIVSSGASDELLTIKLRYKKPKSETSELIEVPVKNSVKKFSEASTDTKFASAVAGFTMVLRDSKFKGSFTLDKAQELAANNLSVRGKRNEYRAEFVELIKKARSLKMQEEPTED